MSKGRRKFAQLTLAGNIKPARLQGFCNRHPGKELSLQRDMGIQGLLPFVQNACKSSSISEFAGCIVAIDGHCWLHKAGYSCAEKLVKGHKTNQYIAYCMRYIDMLRYHKVTPVMVFDGRPLPAKKETQEARREKKRKNRDKAAEFEKNGDLKEARLLYGQSFDITPAMVAEVIQVCRGQGIDCLVAPFEADAQLTYLLNQGIVHLVITEDSDLIAFGCKRIFFKMDTNGRGVLYERRQLDKCLGSRATLLMSPGRSNDDNLFTRFRYACIFNGCDYHPGGLSGVGIQKAMKAMMGCTNTLSIEKMLARMPLALQNLRMEISEEYKKNFIRANCTFLYQIVFDPLLRRQVSLNPVPPEFAGRDLTFTGLGMMTDQTALLLALGLLMSNEVSCSEGIKKAKSQVLAVLKPEQLPLNSIWTKTYIKPAPLKSPPRTPSKITQRLTVGEVVMIDSSPIKSGITTFYTSVHADLKERGYNSILRSPVQKIISPDFSTPKCKRRLYLDDPNDDIAVPPSPPKKPLSFSAPTTKRYLSRARPTPAFRKLNARQLLSSQKSVVCSSYFSSSLGSAGSSQNESSSQMSECSSFSSTSTDEVIVVSDEQDVSDSLLGTGKNLFPTLAGEIESNNSATSSPLSGLVSRQPPVFQFTHLAYSRSKS